MWKYKEENGVLYAKPHARFLVFLNERVIFKSLSVIGSFDNMSEASEYARKANELIRSRGEFMIKAYVVDSAN